MTRRNFVDNAIESDADLGARNQVWEECNGLEQAGFQLGLACQAFLDRVGAMDFAVEKDGNFKLVAPDDLVKAILAEIDWKYGAAEVIAEGARQEVG